MVKGMFTIASKEYFHLIVNSSNPQLSVIVKDIQRIEIRVKVMENPELAATHMPI